MGYVDVAELLARTLQGVQIAFYVIAGALAILTYRSAKRGLLNTVRTEYQKRVMDRLSDVASELWSEFERESPNWWFHDEYGEVLIEEDRKYYKEHPEAYQGVNPMRGGIRSLPPYQRLDDLKTKIETDPFVPAAIRADIVAYLGRRLQALHEVSIDVTQAYRKYLADRKPDVAAVDEDHHWVHNRANDALYKKGFGISQVRDDVAKLRLAIQKYFESFNPDR